MPKYEVGQNVRYKPVGGKSLLLLSVSLSPSWEAVMVAFIWPVFDFIFFKTVIY